MADFVEYYAGDSLECRINSSIVPAVGSKISIRKKTWVVKHVSYAIDYADKVAEQQTRANVELVPITQGRRND